MVLFCIFPIGRLSRHCFFMSTVTDVFLKAYSQLVAVYGTLFE